MPTPLSVLLFFVDALAGLVLAVFALCALYVAIVFWLNREPRRMRLVAAFFFCVFAPASVQLFADGYQQPMPS